MERRFGAREALERGGKQLDVVRTRQRPWMPGVEGATQWSAWRARLRT
jgi:hypothetical protein